MDFDGMFSGEGTDFDEEWEDVGDDAPAERQGAAAGVSGDLEITLSQGGPASRKRRRVQASSTKEARAEAVAVHQTHALCLLARGSQYDAAADCPCLQARLLSMVDPCIITRVEAGTSAANATGQAQDVSWLTPLVQWFHSTFKYEPPAPLPTSNSAVAWQSVELGAVPVTQQLQRCIDRQRGNADQLGALLVALLRALGLLTRTVWHIEAVSPKAVLADKPNALPTKLPARVARGGAAATSRSSKPGRGRGRGRGRSQAGEAAAAASPTAVARAASAPAAQGVETIEIVSSDEAVKEQPHKSGGKRGKRAAADTALGSVASGSSKKQRGKGALNHNADSEQGVDEGIARQLLHKSASDSQAMLTKQRSNRGDNEFEQQLALAMAATAFQTSEAAKAQGNAASAGNAWKRTSSQDAGKASSSTLPAASAAGQEGWLWSRRAGSVAALRWAEVHVGNEACGRWVAVDGLRNCIDCPHHIERCVPGGSHLLYVVAYQPGVPPKDVTKRYASDYTAIARQRMDDWWRDTLAGRNTNAGHGLSPEHALMLAMSGQVVPLAPPKRRRSLPTAADSAGAHDSVGLQLPGRPVSSGSAGAGPSGAGTVTVDKLRAAREDAELERKVAAQNQALPTTLDGFKHHPMYVLQRHLTKYQALRPGAQLLGLHRGEPYYSRPDVHELHTTDRWRREGRAVRDDEMGAPAKVVEKRDTVPKQRTGKASPFHQQAPAPPAPSGPKPTSELYGFWQTEPWTPEPAVDGKVPKNERGSVEVPPFAKVLPAGTVHLDHAGLVPVCKELGIDFAPAMLGFDARGGAMVPVIRGVVVCQEHAEAVLVRYKEKEEEREQKAAAKRWKTAEAAWMQLLQALWMRVKLQRKYSGNETEEPASADTPQASEKTGDDVGAAPKTQKPARRTRGGKDTNGPRAMPNATQPPAAEPAQQADATQHEQTNRLFHLAEHVEEF